MKRCILKWLMVVGIIALCCVGCSKENNSKVTLSSGVLSWKADKQAVEYEVLLGDKNITCQEEKLNLSELCEQEGEYSVSVSAVSSKGKKREIGTLTFTAKALQKPAISMTETENNSVVYKWKAEPEAGGYEYNLNDGYGFHKIEVGEDGICQVDVPVTDAMTFTILVQSDSKDNIFYIGNETTYDYAGKVLFDMAQLVKYPFSVVSEGRWTDTMKVGTTLSKGIYDLEFSFYLTNTKGASLVGEGKWGRRITHVYTEGGKNITQYIWFCEDGVESHEASGNTLRPADEMITTTLKGVKINKYGETTLILNDFNINEMLIISDVKLNGKSVMSSKVRNISEEEKITFDVDNLKQFMAVCRSKGKWTDEFVIPTDLPNGVYKLEIAYQLMTSEGKRLSDNGKWARRITDSSNGQAVYYCDYQQGTIEGRELPLPTQTVKSTFNVKVTDGKINLRCLDFNQGEIMAVSSVKKVGGTDFRFNMSSLSKYKYVYKRKSNDWTPDSFVIETTKKERARIEVEISYYAMDAEGYMLTGNGKWGRRIVDDNNQYLWICDTAPGEGHPDAAGTIPKSDKLVTKTVMVTLNKQGKFTLTMQDFSEGDTVVITDVKYQGASIISK